MKKTFNSYLVIWTILLAVVNVIAFMAGGIENAGKYSASFWMGYGFISVAFVGQLLCARVAFRADNLQRMFYNLPLITLSYTGLVVSFLVGGVTMAIDQLPYWVGMIACLLVLGLTAISVVKADLAADAVIQVDDKVKVRTFYIKTLMVEAERLLARATTDEIKAECKKVYEAVRYSDPMSNEALSGVESQITIRFASLADAVKNGDAAAVADTAKEITILLNDRSSKCVLLKGQGGASETVRGRQDRGVKGKVNYSVKTVLTCAGILAVTAGLLVVFNMFAVPDMAYNKAIALCEQGDYAQAAAQFDALGDYKDAPAQSKQASYQLAEQHLEQEDYPAAVTLFGELKDYKDAQARIGQIWESVIRRADLAEGSDHTVGLQADGTVVATGNNEKGQCDVTKWKDITAVAAGSWHTVGLKSDGTVVAAGSNEKGQCDVTKWKDITAVAASGEHTVGLKSDGTAVAVGGNEDGQCVVSYWRDITALAVSSRHTVGLKSDGTVIAVGDNSKDQCDVSGWTDITAVVAGDSYTMGLKSDGTMVVAGGKNN